MNFVKTVAVLALSIGSLTACGASSGSPATSGGTNAICDGFDSGFSAAAVIQIGLDSGLDPESVGRVIGEQLRDCPEHFSKIETFLYAGQ